MAHCTVIAATSSSALCYHHLRLCLQWSDRTAARISDILSMFHMVGAFRQTAKDTTVHVMTALHACSPSATTSRPPYTCTSAIYAYMCFAIIWWDSLVKCDEKDPADVTWRMTLAHCYTKPAHFSTVASQGCDVVLTELSHAG